MFRGRNYFLCHKQTCDVVHKRRDENIKHIMFAHKIRKWKKVQRSTTPRVKNMGLVTEQQLKSYKKAIRELVSDSVVFEIHWQTRF